MTGLSIFAAPLLKQVPMSVLFGVFLYMGVCSMIGGELNVRRSQVELKITFYRFVFFLVTVQFFER